MGRGSPRLLTAWLPFGENPVEMDALAVLRGSRAAPAFRRLRETYGRLDAERARLDGTGWLTADRGAPRRGRALRRRRARRRRAVAVGDGRLRAR